MAEFELENTEHGGTAELGPGEVMDDLLHGELKLVQHVKGYRYSVDALLLAAFALPLADGKRVLDMGTGTGVVALIIACRATPIRVAAVEVQSSLAALAQKNTAINKTVPPVEVFDKDAMELEKIFPPDEFDLIVSNPPFRTSNSGRTSPLPEKAAARHEVLMSLLPWLAQAKRVLAPTGSICLVYPVDEEKRVMDTCAGLSLFPARKQYATDRPDGRKRLFLVELKAEKVETRLEPDVPIETDAGKFSLDGHK